MSHPFQNAKKLGILLLFLGAVGLHAESVVFLVNGASQLNYTGSGAWNLSLTDIGVQSNGNAVPASRTCGGCTLTFSFPVVTYTASFAPGVDQWVLGGNPGTGFTFNGAVGGGGPSGTPIVSGAVSGAVLQRTGTVYTLNVAPTAVANSSVLFTALLTNLNLNVAASNWTGPLNLTFFGSGAHTSAFTAGSSFASFQLDSAPEPATLGLLSLGVLFMIASKRRRA